MKTSIERAMEQLEFDVKINAVQFSKMTPENQQLTIESMSKKEQFENLKNLKLFHENTHNLVEWSNEK